MIDSDEKLAGYLPVLHRATWIAVDTEADSLHAYPEKVCLIQISTAEGDELVDPLAALNLAPLLESLWGHELILHAADYDLRLLRKHHRFVPRAIFDTMLAARLLGQRQFGLAHLVSHYLGVTLEKGSQKADWARRPLTERMERYARNDTHYLKPLADRLRSELQQQGRLAWHSEWCAQLVVECATPPTVDADLLWRVKGSSRLSRPALAVLRELWHWRESEALAANRPPFFILSHEALVHVAAAAATGEDWQPLLPQRLSPRRRAGVAEAIERGQSVPATAQPKYLQSERRWPTEQEKRRMHELERRRDRHAHELGIDPTLIASKGMLARLAHDWEANTGELMKWQRSLLE